MKINEREQFIKDASLALAAATVSRETEGYEHVDLYRNSITGHVTSAAKAYDPGTGQSVDNRLYKTRAQLIAEDAVEIAVALADKITLELDVEGAKEPKP